MVQKSFQNKIKFWVLVANPICLDWNPFPISKLSLLLANLVMFSTKQSLLFYANYFDLFPNLLYDNSIFLSQFCITLPLTFH